MHKLLKVFAPIALVLTLAATSIAGEKVQAIDSNQVSSANGQVQHQSFDGKSLYDETFRKLLELHIALGDPAKREAWARQWKNKFDATGELATENGTDQAIRKMIISLGQRFDSYLNSSETDREKEAREGNFVGIGVELGFTKVLKPEDVKDSINGPVLSSEITVEVKEPVENGPASAAGMKKGDIFKMVGQTPVAGLTLQGMIDLIRGPEGTTVDLTMIREGKEVSFTITRSRVKATAVKFKDLNDGISHVQLRNFVSANVTAEMYEALMRARNGKALILDLRGNPGGNLVTAHDVLEMLLPEGTGTELHRREGDGVVIESFSLLKDVKFTILQTPGASAKFDARPRRPLLIPFDMPIVVLINGGSASASEIVSGALSYSKRAVIVGTNTVGKGVGQSVISLPFNRTLHVTTFEFRPKGVKMDWAGVAPDHKIEAVDDGSNQLEFAKNLAISLAEQKLEKDRRLNESELKHREAFEESQKTLKEQSK